jgi:hypothetical protein
MVKGLVRGYVQLGMHWKCGLTGRIEVYNVRMGASELVRPNEDLYSPHGGIRIVESILPNRRRLLVTCSHRSTPVRSFGAADVLSETSPPRGSSGACVVPCDRIAAAPGVWWRRTADPVRRQTYAPLPSAAVCVTLLRRHRGTCNGDVAAKFASYSNKVPSYPLPAGAQTNTMTPATIKAADLQQT